jgi:hypothetical protein
MRGLERRRRRKLGDDWSLRREDKDRFIDRKGARIVSRTWSGQTEIKETIVGAICFKWEGDSTWVRGKFERTEDSERGGGGGGGGREGEREDGRDREEGLQQVGCEL